jgi:hypothetical protein
VPLTALTEIPQFCSLDSPLRVGKKASTVLILLGTALVIISPALAVLDYNLWGGGELLPENGLSAAAASGPRRERIDCSEDLPRLPDTVPAAGGALCEHAGLD